MSSIPSSILGETKKKIFDELFIKKCLQGDGLMRDDGVPSPPARSFLTLPSHWDITHKHAYTHN